MIAEGKTIGGQLIDDQTRCIHYGTTTDVIAIKFSCCQRYYACHRCHEASAGHPAERWPASQHDQKALLCGMCSSELRISTYFEVHCCPECSAPFNDACRLHRHLYFEG
jgi:uncharacterized CHY-type Zn-finger protein